MTEKEILIAFLGATLNLPSDRIAEVLYKKADDETLTEELEEGALEALKNLDRERVSKLKPDQKQFDNGYKKAQKEVAEQWEKLIREKTGIDDLELKNEELLTAGLAKVSNIKIDEDKVKNSPAFIAREKELLRQIEAVKSEGQAAIEEFKAQQSRSQRVEKAKNRAKEILLAKKPVLEEDQRVAEKRINYFLKEFEGFDYEEVNEELIPIKDGKRLENEHLHPIGFDNLVESFASESFIFQVQDPKGNAGNQTQKPGFQTPTIKVPTDKSEFEKAYNDEKDPAKKTQMAKAFYQAGTS